jgi:hypothetical protein
VCEKERVAKKMFSQDLSSSKRNKTNLRTNFSPSSFTALSTPLFTFWYNDNTTFCGLSNKQVTFNEADFKNIISANDGTVSIRNHSY